MTDSEGVRTILVDEVLGRIDNLPTISAISMRVGELVNDPRADARQIGEVMRQDPSLTAKVLRLVNSSYYAIPGGVSDVARAISFLGFNTLHQLVLSVTVLRTLRREGFDSCALWLHSLAVGSCAEVLARRLGHRDPAACFTAGLLHDVGKVALAISEPLRYDEAVGQARRVAVRMCEAERAVGLPTHEQVGSRLARRWRFPASLTAAIQYHHDIADPRVRRELAPPLLAVVDMVALADEVCRHYAIGDGGSPPVERIDHAALDRLGLTRVSLDNVHADLMRRLETSKIFLELIDGG